jgi:2-dehydropantoate 2-reductase
MIPVESIRVQIMGAGAIGSLFGALIQLSGYDVYYVARGEQLRALKDKGLEIRGIINEKLEVNAGNAPENADLTIVAVKAYDTENAGKALSNVNCGVTLTIQNGIGNKEVLEKFLNRVIGGVTTYGANKVKPGIINYAGEGMTYVGNDGFISDDAKFCGEVLSDCGIKCEIVQDITRRIWMKAIVNAVINPLTAICRVRNGAIVEIEELWSIAEKIVEECENVTKATGIDLRDDPTEVVRDVAIKTYKNKSSMLQDIELGKKTEIDYINGKIVEIGESLGVDVRINKIITNIVRGVEKANAIE